MKVKAKALQLAEMKDFYRKREEGEDQFQYNIQNAYKDLAGYSVHVHVTLHHH